MSPDLTLKDPWLVAVWPGMGQVAISAGYFLMAKLGMHQLAEFVSRELFEVEYIEVRDGLVHSARLPRSRLFVWIDPHKHHDIIVFIGEAQPPRGKYAFCSRLIEYARELGVQRVFTFAAMATQMDPHDDSRTFAVAADEHSLDQIRRLDIQILQDGQIGGLNGVLLGVAAEQGMRGACLLGEMPQFLAPLLFPKASLAVLEAFTAIADIELDLTELHEQAEGIEENIDQMLIDSEAGMQDYAPSEDPPSIQPAESPAPSPQQRERIEQLFSEAAKDRSKAYELKKQLDHLGLFAEYEDRFLDLFHKPH